MLWLEEQGHSVFEPPHDFYQNMDEIFPTAESACEENSFDLVVGSSVGGFVAYWLSQKYHIPAILFNPSLIPSNTPKPLPPKGANLDQKPLAVLFGRHDDIVDPQQNLEYLLGKHKDLDYVWLENVGHRIPFDVFMERVGPFLSDNL